MDRYSVLRKEAHDPLVDCQFDLCFESCIEWYMELRSITSELRVQKVISMQNTWKMDRFVASEEPHQ
jgi:hypothetical protein